MIFEETVDNYFTFDVPCFLKNVMTIKVALTNVWILILLNVVLFAFTDSILQTVFFLMRDKNIFSFFPAQCVTNLNL